MDDDSSDSCNESRIPYLRLLNTLANDLDYMLNDLYTTPPSTLRIGGDAFLEPYMQGLSNDVNHTIDEVFDGSSNVFKKRLHDEYIPRDDRMSSFSSPVDLDSVDTPIDEKAQHFILEVNAGSQGSLNQLISGDECSESSSLNSSLVGDEETPCDITLVERLIRSHPIWFLPGIQRAGAFHLLQGKEDGNFVVRQSSQNSTMAISVRLPSGKGPYIEHYLIQVSEDGQLGLESSENKFSSIPLLIAHYCQCCDELPVQLTLPRAIRDAKNRQQLTSLALLGQEFWRYPMANPRQSMKMEDESPSSLSTMPLKESSTPPQQMQNTPFLGSSSSNSPASSLSSFESSNNNNNSSCSALEQPSLVFDLDSSNIPLDESSPQSNSLMTTFKGSPQFSSVPYNQIGIPVTPESPSSLPVETSHSQVCIRRPRPTPPNTLNLISTTASTISCRPETSSTAIGQSQLVTPTSKTPPPPPPRWTKPSLTNCTSSSPNFTVTTTLTLTVNKDTSPSPDLKVSSPPLEKAAERHISSQIVHATSLTASLPTIAPTPLPRSHIPHVTSPTSPSQTSQVLSPVSEGNTRPFTSRRNRRHHKESYHYQESDIIESYHRSTLADKVSDYEDLWAQDSSLVSTFKPQPPPRSLPPSVEDVSSGKNVFKKTSVSSLTNEMTPEKPATPSGTPEPNKNRFGLVLDVSGGEVVPLTPSCDAVSPATSFVEPPKTSTPEAVTPASEPPKLGSPFYAEPADAIKQAAAALKRRTKPPVFTPQPSIRNRHSDPTSLHQWPPITLSGGGNLERIDSKEELITNGSFSSSVDNLVALRKPKHSSGSVTGGIPFSKNVKAVEPPRIGQNKNKHGDWTLDSSWEFFSKEGNNDDEDAKSDKNLTVSSTSEGGDNPSPSPEPENTSSNRSLTVQEMIAQKLPKLRLSPVFDRDKNLSTRTAPSFDVSNSSQGSDSNNNSDKVYHNGFSVLSQVSDTSDTQTEFSEPWDSSQWDYLFNKVTQAPQDESNNNNQSRCRSFKEKLDPLLSPPRLKALARTRVTATTPGAAVRNYALRLAADKDTVFAQNIDNFISCTKDSKETKPVVVMRNMRQFMSGMKNYLVTHGEREFMKEVERERSKLKSTEFLNLDAILEGVMHKLVITPLKEHLLTLFVQEYSTNGAIQLLGDNIVYARTKPAHELGIKEKLVLPSEDDLEKIYNLFKQMQAADSPLEKLELLLSAIAIIFHSVKLMNSGPEGVFLGADDFLPIFVWVLVRTGMVAAEIEAEYMWGLLHPSLLSGEGGYYLTTLSSAVNVLKNFRPVNENSAISRLSGSLQWCHEQLSEFRSIFKVVVPDEMNGSLLTKTLPVRPNSTTRDICKIIAHKLRITNPQDYSLFKLVEGEETPMNDLECPQDMKIELAKAGKHCIFAYKRLDAKIAWPTTTTSQTVKL